MSSRTCETILNGDKINIKAVASIWFDLCNFAINNFFI
jgi:hypothetical protein